MMFPKLALNLLSLRAMTFEQRTFNELMSGLLKRKEEVLFFVEVSMIVSENSLVILCLNKRKILRALLIILMMNECMNE